MPIGGKSCDSVRSRNVGVLKRMTWNAFSRSENGSLAKLFKLPFRRPLIAPRPQPEENAGVNVCLALQMELKPPVWLKARGTSMLPWRFPGCEVRIERVGTDLETGLIIVFRQGAKLYYHRVIEQLDRGLWRTKGDTLIESDTPVSHSDVIGQVTAVRRGSRVRGLRSDRGAALLSAGLGRWFSRFFAPDTRRRSIVRLMYLAALLSAWPFRRLTARQRTIEPVERN